MSVFAVIRASGERGLHRNRAACCQHRGEQRREVGAGKDAGCRERAATTAQCTTGYRGRATGHRSGATGDRSGATGKCRAAGRGAARRCG
jgi:hypothetical protein